MEEEQEEQVGGGSRGGKLPSVRVADSGDGISDRLAHLAPATGNGSSPCLCLVSYAAISPLADGRELVHRPCRQVRSSIVC